MLAAFAWLSSHWLPAVILLALMFVMVLYPGAAMALVRWVVGTQEGRIAALVAASIITFHVYGDFRYQAGYSAAVAKQKAAATRAAADAAQAALRRDSSAQAIGDKAQAQTAAHIDTGQKATAAAQERTHVRIVEVPAIGGCAGPDAGVVRDVQAAHARVRAAADRMRRIGASPAR